MPISIGIPFYNAEEFLADAIRSVFAQTHRDWELILVDDGSTDRSLEIAESVKDPRVRVLSDGEHKGLPCRLNQIAKNARGEYLVRMDADDLMHPERLAHQVEFLQAHPEIDLVATGMYTVNRANHAVGKRFCNRRQICGRALVLGKGLAHATIMGRTAWFLENPYDPTAFRAQDRELWCRTFTAKRLRAIHLPEPLYLCREEGCVTLDKMLGSYRTGRRMIRKYGPELLGWTGTILHVGLSHLKGGVYRAFDSVGQIMVLVDRRNTPLMGEEQLAAQAIIDTILRTRVPGFRQCR